ncbi:16S rRNA (uracil(1498)-N(3))-methyltransferase [Micromonospora zhanjiangensis]|uniref:Ribosomal RNA small subunit methyltransferase E n=1 Tax=Micromonospora zhanjiangensis TaxID=1522057 RepID=A0ABV8KW32_9ACTN
MSAPLFLVGSLPPADSYTLAGPEGHHAATVQRLRVGEELLLADGRGGTATAEVVSVGKGTLDLTVTSRRYADPPDPRLVVAQGIAKGDRGELAVQAMTEVGVDEIVPWAAARSVVQWRGERGGRARDKWAATAREAAKQSRRPWLPVVSGDPSCSTAQVADRVGAAAGAYVLHEEASVPLSRVDLPTDGEIVLVIGPEGGISPDELARLAAAGGVPVRLGPEVLRTSTAGVAALSVLAARLGRW